MILGSNSVSVSSCSVIFPGSVSAETDTDALQYLPRVKQSDFKSNSTYGSAEWADFDTNSTDSIKKISVDNPKVLGSIYRRNCCD